MERRPLMLASIEAPAFYSCVFDFSLSVSTGTSRRDHEYQPVLSICVILHPRNRLGLLGDR
jgi:hypothetical protein